MKNKIIIPVGILVLVMIVLIVGFLPNYQEMRTISQSDLTKAGFDVTPIDAKASVSAELVEKDGVAYELLCVSATKVVPKQESYNCEKEDYNKPIYKTELNKTTDKNEEIVIGYEKIQTTCSREIYVNESYCSKKTGIVKVGNKLISKERYMCGVGICDEYIGECKPKKIEEYPCEKSVNTPVEKTINVNVNGTNQDIQVIEYQNIVTPSVCRRLVENKNCVAGKGDGNGDGICQAGETCVSFEEFVK